MRAEERLLAGIARWAAGNPVFVVTALGLILYGLLRLANSVFYDPLAVKPEEVGLGYVETLSQSAVGVLLVLLTSFLLFGVGVGLIMGSQTAMRAIESHADHAAMTWKRSTQLAAAAGAVLLVVIAVGGAAYLAIRNPPVLYRGGLHRASGLVSYALALVIALLLLRVVWNEMRAGRARRLLLPAGVAFVLAVALALATVILQAWNDSVAVRKGAVRHPTFFGLPFGSWGADAAWVEWVAPHPPRGFAEGRRRCLLYLGRASGTAVFYDAAARENKTFRAPASAVVITTRNSRHNGEEACP